MLISLRGPILLAGTLGLGLLLNVPAHIAFGAGPKSSGKAAPSGVDAYGDALPPGARARLTRYPFAGST